MRRKPIVGMSLKIYVNKMEQAVSMAKEVMERMNAIKDVDVFLIPSMGTVYPVAKALEGSNILYGVQNIAPRENGAMTGEFSIESAVDLGCHLVELGHAERKSIFREDYKMINEKIGLTIQKGLMPIVCVGETDRSPERKKELTSQISQLLKGLDGDHLSDLVLAYEPEWAIGQEKPAEPEYVHGSMRIIREILTELYGEAVSERIRLIYGGSANKENARKLVSSEDIDGLFIGRFGHDIANFEEIVQNVRETKEEKS